jgi:hypothetical protein
MSAKSKAKRVVAQAWEITNNEKGLIRYGFVASFFSIIGGGAYIAYQVNAFLTSETFGGESNYGELISLASDFLNANQGLIIPLIVLAIIFALGYFIVPILTSGALTKLVAQSYLGEKKEKGIATSFLRFLPLLEVSAVEGTAKPQTIFSEWSFLIRNIGRGAARLFFPLLVFIGIVGIIVIFLFIFTTPFIILRKNNFSQSISNSAKLVIKNFGTTLSLFFIFAIIELRVMLNIFLILFLPLAVVAVTGFFTVFLAQNWGFIIALVVALILIGITSFLTGTLYVFSHAIWTIAFLEFSENEEDID